MSDSLCEVRAALVTLSLALLVESDLRRDLERVLMVAQASVPGCEAGSVTLIVEGQPRTEAIIDRVVVAIDVAQYENREGPCLLAAATSRPIVVDLIPLDERVPTFAERATPTRVQSSLSLPVVAGSETVGSLDLYSWHPSAFDATSQDLGAVLASQVGVAVAKSRLLPAGRDVAVTAQKLSDEKADIAVAEGMLIVLEDCTIEQAAQLLRNAAWSEVQTLAVIARRIIAEVNSQRVETRPPNPDYDG